MNFNNEAYNIKIVTFEKGFLDVSVDVTFIITMTNSKKRQESIFKQLQKYVPTKKVIIVYNNGFKEHQKWKDDILINQSYQDLTYTNMFIFNYANKENYKNILILEDDFIFTETILEKQVQNDINSFLLTNEIGCYYLGCIPIRIQICDLFSKHISGNEIYTTHSCIYSKKARNDLLKLYKENNTIKHIDSYQPVNSYYYYKPLCVQFFGPTENRKSWFHITNNLFVDTIGKLFLYLLCLWGYILGLDNTYNLQMKYQIHYFTIIILHILFYLYGSLYIFNKLKIMIS